MKSKFTSKEIVLLALLSTAWAAIEINFGILLQTLQIPFKGAFLTLLALIILFIGRNLVPKRGAVFFMGLTTAFMKFIFLGGMAISPVIAILMEVTLVELCLLQKQPRKLNYYTAGAAGLVWSFLHPFFIQGLLVGWGILKVYRIIIEKGMTLLGIEQQFFGIFLLLFVSHIILGAIAGAIGYKFSQFVIRHYNNIAVYQRYTEC